MDLSHLKTQIMTMFMMRPSKNGSQQDIFAILYSMMIMNVMEVVFRNAPTFVQGFQTMLGVYFKPKREAWMPLLDKNSKEKEQINSISMSRVYVDSDKQEKVSNIYVDKVDAVLDYVCSLDSAKHIKMDTRYTLNSTDDI